MKQPMSHKSRQYVSRSLHPSSQTRQFSRSEDKKPVIMVIEDEELLLLAITKKLKLEGLEVVPFTNGRQAFVHLENRNGKPDAIWLDYYLGDMDGINFMEKMRSKKELANIPVLVVSNSASPDKVHRMLALGVKGYLIKAEHRLDELVLEIKKLIEKEKT